MLRPLVAICCLLFATSLAAEPSALDGDAIAKGIPGAVLEVDTPLGVKVPIRYFEDGRVIGEARGLEYILGAPSDTGKWWVSSDRLCHKWTKWFDGVLQCMRLSRDGSRIYWRRDDGETGTAVISTPPSPPRLVASEPKSPEPLIRREAPEPSALASASMAGVALFPSSRADVPLASSVDTAPALKSPPIVAKKAAAAPKQVAPAGNARPVDAPREMASAEPKRAALVGAAQNFRVWGVASYDVLNVRDGPSADYRAIGAIAPDAEGIRIVGECLIEWCPIHHRGIRGWVNRLYLIEEAAVGGLRRSQRQQ